MLPATCSANALADWLTDCNNNACSASSTVIVSPITRLILLPLSGSTFIMADSVNSTVADRSSTFSSTTSAVRSFVILAGGYSTWLFCPKIIVPESTSITEPASAIIPVSFGHSGFANAVIVNTWHITSTPQSNLFILCFTLLSSN